MKNVIFLVLMFLFIGCSSKSVNEKLQENELKRNSQFVIDKNLVIDLFFNKAYFISLDKKTYNESIKFCNKLEENGLNNFTLSSFEEIGNIINFSGINNKIYDKFNNKINFDGFYWTTKDSKLKNDMNIIINFEDGKTYSTNINEKGYFVCVSSIKKIDKK